MNAPLQILHLEDDPADAHLVKSILQAEGIACVITHVKAKADFAAALDENRFDLVLSDYTLPAFDGLSALEIVRQQDPHLPFIFVSGTLGEEAAVESLKRGATDYVLKDRLARLGVAVQRAMREAAEHAQRRKLEAQLLRSQRLELIGALAGGIAHDLNNALTPVLAGIQLLGENLSAEDRASMLSTMQNSARRGAEMVRQILSFARGLSGETVSVDLARLISETDNLVKKTFPHSIQTQTNVAPDLNPVMGNATQLHQVLMNLCVNARDAMPGGGKLTLEASNICLEGKRTPWQTEPVKGAYVVLTISDTGHGMPPEVIEQIFEPFFTTKELGKGTGLGLSTVQGIVKSHGGFLEVASHAEEGTIFKVYLPAGGSA